VRRLVVLGSTGSIGRSTLEVVEHLEDVQVVGLSARRNVDVLAAQAARFHPQAVAVEDPGQARRLQGLLPAGIEVLAGRDGVAALAAHPGADLVLVAVVGIAGLLPTLAALRAGKDVALATKEALVAGGSLVTAQARASGKMLLPVDSEHSAIFQCLQGACGAADRAHGFRRAVPAPAAGDALPRDAGGSPVSPHLEDGPENHRGLGDIDEQRVRGAGGALAL